VLLVVGVWVAMGNEAGAGVLDMMGSLEDTIGMACACSLMRDVGGSSGKRGVEDLLLLLPPEAEEEEAGWEVRGSLWKNSGRASLFWSRE